MTTKQRWRAEGRCVDCGRDTGGSRRCRACKAKANERQRRIRAESAPPAKLCSRCSRPARPGRKLCEYHAEIGRRSMRRLDARRSGRESAGTVATCECGQPRAPRRHACERCMFLDGWGSRTSEIVAYLRVHGSSTVQHVAEEFGISYNNAQWALLRMVHRGRVGVRHEEDGPQTARAEYYLIDGWSRDDEERAA